MDGREGDMKTLVWVFIMYVGPQLSYNVVLPSFYYAGGADTKAVCEEVRRVTVYNWRDHVAEEKMTPCFQMPLKEFDRLNAEKETWSGKAAP